MRRAIQVGLRILWTLTLLWVALGSVTAYVGPLNWLSALLLWMSGLVTLLVSLPSLTWATPVSSAWVRYGLGTVALTLALSYVATSPSLYASWWKGLASIGLLLLVPQPWVGRGALIITAALVAVTTGIVLGYTNVLPSITAGNPAHLALLLRYGANANERLYDGTPLKAAVETGRAEVVEMLLRYGADPNGRSSAFCYRQPVLFSAAQLPADQQGVMQVLLRYGADPQATDSRGETALFQAVRYKQPHNVRLLLAAGARLEVHRSDGGTLLEEARLRDFQPLDLLLPPKPSQR